MNLRFLKTFAIRWAKISLGTLFVALIGAGCVFQQTRDGASGGNGEHGRSLASEGPAEFQAPVTPHLAYYTFNPTTNQEKLRLISAQNWNQESARRRTRRLEQLYFANVRLVSERGLYHQACFFGAADEVRNSFFRTPQVVAKVSTDQKLIGVTFPSSKGKVHFRLSSCNNSGKGAIFSDKVLAEAKSDLERLPQSENLAKGRHPQGESGDDDDGNATASTDDMNEGFVVNDKDDSSQDKFVIRADYDKAFGADDLPWRRENLNLSQESDRERFALIMQKYVYENMANQDSSNPDSNFNPRNNANRYWCHMPWLNQGSNGREALHGLTQERNLQPGLVWKDAPLGGDWGVGMFNAVGCGTIQNIFGTEAAPANPPDFTNVKFKDGTVVFKILFTTATQYAPLQGAFSWTAHVSGPNSNTRQDQKVAHVQMDIGIKDSQLKGLSSDANGNSLTDGWLMLTYYFDATYDSPLPSAPYSLQGLPAGLTHMRPMGVQMGYNPTSQGPQTSFIFPGAHTNQQFGMLNGPADNPKSSCMGCHATAGTTTAMAPGVTSAAQWNGLKASGATLDFGQQVALARRNYETKK